MIPKNNIFCNDFIFLCLTLFCSNKQFFFPLDTFEAVDNAIDIGEDDLDFAG